MKARENPFRSECVDALSYRAEGFSWEALEADLDALRGRGAIVGPQGHGKTTLLLEWSGRCEGAIVLRVGKGRRFLEPEQRSKLRDCAGRRVFVDSVEQLTFAGWLELRWRARRAGSLVVTTHRTGRLHTLLECRTSRKLLDELVSELDGAHGDCPGLWEKHGGNVRTALSELYVRKAAAGSRRAWLSAGAREDSP
jgi:hypothetical protein